MKRIPARYIGESGEWVCNLYALTEEKLSEKGFTDFDYQVNPSEEYHIIGAIMDSAAAHSLHIEVIQFALKYIKENSSLTPAMAIRMGYEDWVK
jgi:hypothetical protein